MNKQDLKLLNECNEAYPDGMIEQYFDMKTGKEIPDASGDTLALHIGRECEGADGKNIYEARDTVIHRLDRAIQELHAVILHLAQKNLEAELRGKKP